MMQPIRNWVTRIFSDPQLVILGVLLLAGFMAVFWLGNLLAPVFISMVLAYLLEGMVTGLERMRLPRVAAVIIVFILFMTCLLFLIIWLLPLLSRQIGDLLGELPAMVTRGQKELMLLPEKYPEFISKEQIIQIITFVTQELTRMGQRLLSLSLASLRGIIAFLVYIILVPLMIFFFLKDKYLILNWVKRFLPHERKLAGQVWHDVNLQIGNYIRGKMWEILIVWAVTYLTFSLLKVPFSLLLSLFVGLSVLIPYIGATVMFLPVALIAFFEWGIDSHFAYVMIALAIIQALDGNLLVPLLLSGVVNIHPIAIIISVLFFGGIWGVWGLFFAIPLATLIHAVIQTWMDAISEQRAGKGQPSAPETP
jgi:putative permease